jgi:hypothetical protein
MSSNKARCIILVLYNSFALVEVFLPFSEALRARGHRCAVMIIGRGKRSGFDDHPFYRDWLALTSEVVDLRREGVVKRLLRLISFMVRVRLRHWLAGCAVQQAPAAVRSLLCLPQFAGDHDRGTRTLAHPRKR